MSGEPPTKMSEETLISPSGEIIQITKIKYNHDGTFHIIKTYKVKSGESYRDALIMIFPRQTSLGYVRFTDPIDIKLFPIFGGVILIGPSQRATFHDEYWHKGSVAFRRLTDEVVEQVSKFIITIDFKAGIAIKTEILYVVDENNRSQYKSYDQTYYVYPIEK